MKRAKHRRSSIASERAASYLVIRPISAPITPDRQAKKRWYGTHQFFTRRAWNIVQAYIKAFAPEQGATVLDPFVGSGVTAVEASILGRSGIGFDVNPFAVFYARCAGLPYPNPMDPRKSELMPKFVEIVDSYERRYPRGRLSNSDYLEAATGYGLPTRKLLDHRVDLRTCDMHTPQQLHDLSLLKNCILGAKYQNSLTKDLLLFTLSAAISKCNRTFVSAHGRKESRGGARIFSSYALNLPPEPVELSAFPEFQAKFKKLLQAKQELFVELPPGQGPRVEQLAAQNLSTRVPEDSVDYIFTDPPYGKLIPYLDLSSFFCDWLDLEITSETRELDIIENSSMNRSKEFYYEQMKKAFKGCYASLRDDRWMTLVYAHKNTEYWDAIISACQDVGFEFVNAVYERPDVIWSLTKKKNKATTFSGELYLNFRKAQTPRAKLIAILRNDFRKLVQNTVELAIVHNEGCATLEDVYSELVPVLARYGMTGKFKSENVDIKEYLEQDFTWNDRRKGYELPPKRKLSSFIPIEERVLFYVRDFLIMNKNTGTAAPFDSIVSSVLPNLVNGDIPSRESILDVLKRIAVKNNAGEWILAEDDDGQIDLPLPIASAVPKTEPKTTPHNLLLWKLMFIGSKAGMSAYLGKNEQRDVAFAKSGLPFLTSLPFETAPGQSRKIEQIDCIWTKDSLPKYAFEVEESTSITTAFERFSKLMEVSPDIAISRRLIVVVPRRRRRKLVDAFTESIYVGKPLYFENKLRILFSDDLDSLYEDCRDRYFKLSRLEGALKRFDDL